MQAVGIEPEQVRCVRRAHLDDPVDGTLADLLGDRHRLEIGVETHRLVEFDEHVVVPTVRIPWLGEAPALDDVFAHGPLT